MGEGLGCHRVAPFDQDRLGNGRDTVEDWWVSTRLVRGQGREQSVWLKRSNLLESTLTLQNLIFPFTILRISNPIVYPDQLVP